MPEFGLQFSAISIFLSKIQAFQLFLSYEHYFIWFFVYFFSLKYFRQSRLHIFLKRSFYSR